MRVLVAEDDKRIAQSLSVALAAAGFVTELSANGEDAWFREKRRHSMPLFWISAFLAWMD